MSTLANWIDFWNRKVKRMTIWDLKLVQVWTAAWVLILVKVCPCITTLSIWWFVLMAALCVPWLLVVFRRKAPPTADPADV